MGGQNFMSLTRVVDAGEEAVICELLAYDIQLDAKMGHAALFVHEAVTEGVSLPPQTF